jgi:microcompartment protein CcmK/EutM
LIPELVPQLDHNAKVLNKYVNKQVSAKAGTRYTIDSISIGNDEVVIVVTK